MAFDSNIEYVVVEKCNLDLECQLDLMSGKGIRISEVESFSKKNEKLYNGLQSSFFGSDFGDEESFRERWSCKCKKYIGQAYEGLRCEQCDSVVEYSDIDLTKFGWIILDHFKIINPIYAAKLSDLLGSYDGDKLLNRILDVNYSEDDTIEFTDKELVDLKKHPFLHKGMIWLVNHLDEVIDWYGKKPSKSALVKELREDIENIATSCIPVYSSLLRTEIPGEKGGKDFRMKINTTYRAIIRLANAVNRVSPDDFNQKTINSIVRQLAAIQRELDIVFTQTYKDLTSKTGIIVSKVLGGRHNFSARNIIVPSSGVLHTDEIGVGYLTFLELFRYEIINLYSKLHGVTVAEASNVYKKGTNHFNPTLYSIMKYMITDPESKKACRVLISRNPCINYGSSLMMRIAFITEDIDIKTLTIPSAVIKGMGADFDGDIVNIMRILTDHLIKKFDKNLNPKYNLHISRMDGRVNPDTMPIKDEIIGFYCFNTL